MKLIRTLMAASVLLVTSESWALAAELVQPTRYDIHEASEALGAVVWSHHKARLSEGKHASTPGFVMTLNRAGWDVFRVNRTWSSDRVPESTGALIEHVSAIRAKGYERIVLMGQSYGAWISLNAASKLGDIYAVVALAPAAYGSWKTHPNIYHKNATRLYPILSRLKSSKIFLAFFKDDEYNYDDRGKRAKQIFEENGVAFKLLDEPAGLKGHGAAFTYRFTAQYMRPIARFIDPQGLGCATTTQSDAAVVENLKRYAALMRETGSNAWPPASVVDEGAEKLRQAYSVDDLGDTQIIAPVADYDFIGVVKESIFLGFNPSDELRKYAALLRDLGRAVEAKEMEVLAQWSFDCNLARFQGRPCE